jgi:hypothetical protein
MVLLPVRIYRYSFSAFMGRQCRYLPTCSEYAEEAVARHGGWVGGWMALARLTRCHPWGASGFDPVPATRRSAAPWFAPWRHGEWRGPRADDAKAGGS